MAQPIDLKKWVELGAAKEAGEVAAMVACALAVGAAVARGLACLAARLRGCASVLSSQNWD